MEQIHITLRTAASNRCPRHDTGRRCEKYFPRLADAALVARVAAPNDGEGELIDLRRLWITT